MAGKKSAFRLEGARFGKLKVIKRVENRFYGPPGKERYHQSAMWFCICDCGGNKIISTGDLNAGYKTSCGCLYEKRGKKKRPFESIYNYLVAEAKDNSRELTISYEDYLEFTKIPLCWYCASPILWSPYTNQKRGEKVRRAYYLDRKDNTVGYTKENCVVCCPSCNLTKGDRFTYNEFMLLSEGLTRIQELRKLCTLQDKAS